MRVFIKTTSITIIRHIYREANEATDWMTQMGHTIPHHVIWKSSPSFSAVLVAKNQRKILIRRIS